MMLYYVDKKLVNEKDTLSIIEYWAAAYGKEEMTEQEFRKAIMSK